MSTPPPLPLHNPYAAPVARVDDADPATLELADRGIRLLAAILDSLAIVVALVPVFIAIPFVERQGGDPDDVVFAVMMAVTLALMIAMLVWNLVWLHRYGQTIGKRILKIRIVRGDGSRCALSRVVFARWLPVTLLGMLPLIGYVASLVDALMIFREDRRCLHDLIADTVVVRA